MNTSEIIGLGASIIVLAGLSMAIIYGDRTAKVIGTGASGFAKVIQAATQQKITA